MPLTIEFKEIVRDRIKREPEFGWEILSGAMEALLENEFAIGKLLLRDYINGTIGFQKLATLTGRNEKSLMRMFSVKGNPQTANFFQVIRELQIHTDVQLVVRTRKFDQAGRSKTAEA